VFFLLLEYVDCVLIFGFCYDVPSAKMHTELVWMAFASTAAAGIFPLLPEPTELFKPDNGLLDLPPQPYVFLSLIFKEDLSS
jgi:hypothetical protein